MKNRIRKLLNEGLVNIEAKNLLNWFKDHYNHTFVFFDTETTGLNKTDGDHVTQLGAIACFFNPDTLRFAEIDKFNEYVRLSPEIMNKLDSEKDLVLPDDRSKLNKMFDYSKRAILKYNHYDIDKSAMYDDELSVLTRFDDFLENHDPLVLLAHNAPFDLRFVEITEMFKAADREVFDTSVFFKRTFFPILKKISQTYNDKKDLLDKFGEKKSSALVNLINSFSDPSELHAKLEMAHEAVQDCRNMMEVFEKGLFAIYQHLNTDI